MEKVRGVNLVGVESGVLEISREVESSIIHHRIIWETLNSHSIKYYSRMQLLQILMHLGYLVYIILVGRILYIARSIVIIQYTKSQKDCK